MTSERERALREAGRSGDMAAVARALPGLDAIAGRVERIGGPRAMARFLAQRGHLLDDGEDEDLPTWLDRHLAAAEPLHVLDLAADLAAAEAAGHDAIAKRIRAHRQFLQPPDPTRWSRPVPRREEVAFLAACQRGDRDAVTTMLAGDASLVAAMNIWGQDGLALIGGYGSEQGPALVPILVAAEIPKRAYALAGAAFWGGVGEVEAMVRAGLPLRAPIDGDALWCAAAGTRHAEVSDESFRAVATLLVEAGAPPDCADRWGETAWGIASPSARAILEELGATPAPNVPGRYDASGRSAVMIALDEGREPSSDAPLDLNEAAALGERERIVTCLEDAYHHRPQVLVGGPPERPLHVAAFYDRPEVLLTLLERGYSPGEVNQPTLSGHRVGPEPTWGKTPLAVAVERGHTEVHRVLMNSVDFFQGRRARRK